MKLQYILTMRIAWLCIFLYTFVLCPVSARHERSTKHHSTRFKLLHKIHSRLNNHHKKHITKSYQHELPSLPAQVKHGHLFHSKFKHRKKSINTKGSTKGVIVKVNGQNVYSSDAANSSWNTSLPTPSPVPTTTPTPQTHNINLHINLTKAPSPTDNEINQPMVMAAAPGLLSPPKPQTIVALVPSMASQPAQVQSQPAQVLGQLPQVQGQLPQVQVQPAVAPPLLPQVQPPAPLAIPPVATAPPTKKGESSLSKILLTAALLKTPIRNRLFPRRYTRFPVDASKPFNA
ncbi:hypothetical protein OS493_002355 [Desmophyllum pertusum]|uniref:Uncharacterized protein n=1 Tax=Desmophyllum pertusum TaxID=174260 RepID=A0A9W9YSW6_9CNID|nr:hypothetical protein OS493_002355 [Desmophyllum pertusum]